MSDNTVLSAAVGVGDSIRTDLIGGIKFPVSKIALGADGSDDGLVSTATPLPVSDAGVSLTVDGNVSLIPTTVGGLLVSHLVSAGSTNATVAKAAAGQVYGWVVSNINSACRYLKIYNTVSAPTVGTDIPVLTILLPGSTTGGVAVATWPAGIAFSLGVSFALTTGAADADANAVASGDIVVNLLYK